MATVEPASVKFLCGRCYGEVDAIYPANCAEKPEKPHGQPHGMYRCPDCKAMLLAGYPHPSLCIRCLNREHPDYDI